MNGNHDIIERMLATIIGLKAVEQPQVTMNVNFEEFKKVLIDYKDGPSTP